MSPRPPLHGSLLRVLAHSWHTGGGLSASFEDRLVEFTFEALARELPDCLRIVNLLEEREPRPLELLGPVLAERILRHGQADATPNGEASRGWLNDGRRPRADRQGVIGGLDRRGINPGYVRNFRTSDVMNGLKRPEHVGRLCDPQFFDNVTRLTHHLPSPGRVGSVEIAASAH